MRTGEGAYAWWTRALPGLEGAGGAEGQESSYSQKAPCQVSSWTQRRGHRMEEPGLLSCSAAAPELGGTSDAQGLPHHPCFGVWGSPRAHTHDLVLRVQHRAPCRPGQASAAHRVPALPSTLVMQLPGEDCTWEPLSDLSDRGGQRREWLSTQRKFCGRAE